jgi:hypothetical protein
MTEKIVTCSKCGEPVELDSNRKNKDVGKRAGRPSSYRSPDTIRKIARKVLEEIVQDENEPSELRVMAACNIIDHFDFIYRGRDEEIKRNEKKNKASAENNKFHMRNLSDRYVLGLIRRDSKLKNSDIPNELVEIKRAQLKLIRELRDKK